MGVIMRKVQTCKKCGKVFSIRETTGPGLGMPNIDEVGSKMCLSCGAYAVVWMEEGKSTGSGCAGLVLLILGLGLVGCFLLW
jgi:hypothetical protein